MFQTLKTKVLAFLASMKPKAAALAAKWPLPVGIAVGYFGHSAIKVAISFVTMALKLAFKL
jgi:hypothetical protein